MARFAGSVQGVVVQMVKLGVQSSSAPKAFSTASRSAASKSTYTERSCRSSYSSSASASAVRLAMDQCTGLSAR